MLLDQKQMRQLDVALVNLQRILNPHDDSVRAVLEEPEEPEEIEG